MQDIGGFNPFKWQKKLEPLAYEKSRKEIYSGKGRNCFADSPVIFFDLATRQTRNWKLAHFNLGNADTLFAIGKKRNRLGTLTKDDLLELEMARLQAEATVSKVELALREAQFQFNSIVGADEHARFELILPHAISSFSLELKEVTELAEKYHPLILDFRKRILEADMEVEQSRKEKSISSEFKMPVSD